MTSVSGLTARAVTGILLLVFTSAAQAIPMVGTTGTVLYKFDSVSPETVTTLPLNGLVEGEKLIGLDFRPATGELYGVGQTGRLYVINQASGAATNLSGAPTFALSGGTFGTDISAVDDRLRIVSNTHQNIRINLDNGEVAATDTMLSESGFPSNVAGLAYTNAVPGAVGTTAYAIGAADGRLLRIGSVNGLSGGAETGVVTRLRFLGLGTGLNPTLGFDIGPNGTAYLAINLGAQLRFYTVNLKNGATQLVGFVGSTEASTTFTGLTAQTGPQTFTNSATIKLPEPFQADNFVERASPYPSNISVSGLIGVVTKLKVIIQDFRHRAPEEVEMLLVSPNGRRKMVIWGHAGGDFSTCGILCDNQSQQGNVGPSISIHDGALNFLPDQSALNASNYRPTDYPFPDIFPGPAPADDPYAKPPPTAGATFANTFNGIAPNGTWSLWVADSVSSPPEGVEDDTGRIQSGWSLEVTAVPTPTPPPSSLANISTRLRVETGDNVLIAGFIVTGDEPKRVMLRGIGPSLALPDVLADPKLDLYAGGTLITSNDNWQSAANKQEILDSTIPPNNDLEAAIVTILNPGAYTAVMSGVDNGTGVGVVEVYDLTPNINSRLGNISTRGLVQTGNNVLIAGTIVVGPLSQKVIVRGIGPSLDVSNKLANPFLELRDSSGTLLMANDDWRSDQEAEIIATTLPPTSNLESAIVRTLAPGNYATILQGAGGDTGVGVVEIYALP